MDDFEKSYKIYNEKSKIGFGKSVVFPFISGILGASLVVGVCFGVPQIKEKLISSESELASVSSSKEQSNLNITPETNSNLENNSAVLSLSSYSDATAAIAKKVQPSVVGIKVEYTVRSFFSQSGTVTASGSGIIISEDGYILTNNHVINSKSGSSFYQISEANSIKVYLFDDSTAYDATIIGSDTLTDLAVLKIEKNGLTPIEIGDSSTVSVGSFTMAVGSPLGLDNSVTMGTVSAVNREITDEDGRKFVLIQTDAAINSGNSGGALVNSYGQLIGVNTLKASASGVEGIGFAIPINSAKEIYTQLIEFKKVKRPYIGIEGIDIDESISKYYNLPIGLYVKYVADFSPAQKAGLQIGDVITSVDNTPIKTLDELNDIKYKHSIGDTIKLKFLRNGEEKEISIVLAEQP
ncbi:MAG: trypsin-like peptidase domain-containing protein [Clostridia bacterium]|nr:trypsin-like peptidase domain-containing protein [Clostridia bacterium]